jgi:ABC-type uncharacterized transport system substrate-binding protein
MIAEFVFAAAWQGASVRVDRTPQIAGGAMLTSMVALAGLYFVWVPSHKKWSHGYQHRAPVPTSLHAAAGTLGLHLHVFQESTERDFDTVFATAAQLQAGALVISTDPFLTSRNEQLAALTVRHAVSAISQNSEFVAAGGLMSYGGTLVETCRLTGVYVGRILSGEKPAVLPIQLATKVELIINRTTAKALGLTVSLALLARADEVIE